MVSLHAALLLLSLSAPGQPVLLDFYADWCGPCRGMDSTVKELAAKGYPVRRVNIDQERELAAKFRVQSIPCFVMIVDGKEVDRVVGGTSFAQLERMCKLGRPAPAPLGAMLARNRSAKGSPAASGTGPAAPPVAALPVATNSGAARILPASYNRPSAAAADFDTALISATVRLRIEDADGHSCGSGTLIDCRGGEALILTCGHLFRDSKGKGRIEVDLFGPTPTPRVPGRLISYDLKRDLGLVTIRVPGPVVVARVASSGARIQPAIPVTSVGCNNGDSPTAQHSRVTTLDKFLGPPNIQVAGQPVEGRSGGGLFSAEGLVIGVCNAADPSDREGLFAALGSIHSILDEARLSSVYQNQPSVTPPKELVAAVDPFATRQAAPPPDRSIPAASPASVATQSEPAGPIAPSEQAAMDEIHRRIKEGAEVVCVIRNSRDPQGKTEVLMLDKVSPAFLKQLAAEGRPQDGRIETSLEVPKLRRPILEWDASVGYKHQEPLPAVAP